MPILALMGALAVAGVFVAVGLTYTLGYVLVR